MAYGDFDIAVGEEVGVVRRNRNWGGILFSKFGTVTKINGHGHIYVQCEDQEYRFTRRGYAYKDAYGPGLMHAAQLRAELAREEERKTRARLAREMEQTLKDGWSYSGTFHVSQESVARLKNLVAEMEKLIVEA
jgi:type VI protein secretion system component VasF